MRAVEHFDEVFFAEIQHNRQADGRPQAVSSADPVPKIQTYWRYRYRIRQLLLVGRYGNEVFGHGTFIACMIQEPFTRGQGVGQEFLGW